MRHQKHGLQVCHDYLVPVFLFNESKRHDLRAPGIVHQNIDSSKIF